MPAPDAEGGGGGSGAPAARRRQLARAVLVGRGRRSPRFRERRLRKRPGCPTSRRRTRPGGGGLGGLSPAPPLSRPRPRHLPWLLLAPTPSLAPDFPRLRLLPVSSPPLSSSSPFGSSCCPFPRPSSLASSGFLLLSSLEALPPASSLPSGQSPPPTAPLKPRPWRARLPSPG